MNTEATPVSLRVKNFTVIPQPRHRGSKTAVRS
jgi:hypothetical protein